jgi:hypothetical protein
MMQWRMSTRMSMRTSMRMNMRMSMRIGMRMSMRMRMTACATREECSPTRNGHTMRNTTRPKPRTAPHGVGDRPDPPGQAVGFLDGVEFPATIPRAREGNWDDVFFESCLIT